MVILIGTIRVRLPYAQSLKEKRRTGKSLMARLQQRHGLSVREIEAQELHQLLVLGFSFTSIHDTEARDMVHEIEKTVWQAIESEGELLSLETEFVLPGFSDSY